MAARALHAGVGEMILVLVADETAAVVFPFSAGVLDPPTLPPIPLPMIATIGGK